MSTWVVILLLAALLGAIFALYVVAMRRIAGQALSQFEARFRAAEEIVTTGRVPRAWREEVARQIREIEARSGEAAEIERAGGKAKQELLRRLGYLRRMFEAGRYYDSPETKREVLEALRERQAEWAKMPWRELLEDG